VRVADPDPAQKRTQGIVDRLLFDTVELEIVLVDGKAQALGRGTEGIVGVDNEVDLLEDVAQARGGHPPGLGVRTVDLGQEGGEHRWAGRHLGELHRRALGQGHVLEPLAHRKGELVAASVALLLGQEVDLKIALLGRLA
jgi:hypothetical protein